MPNADRENWSYEKQRQRGGGVWPCSSIYSPLGLVWCYFGSSSPEEAVYLVPEANIRLRPAGKHPLGCRGRGRFSVSGVSDTVG